MRTDEVRAQFEFTPQKLVYGGAALGYHGGRPVFVPHALPAERVEAEVVGQAKGVVHARLLRVLDPATERVEPPCPFFGSCGGCHYQHLDPHHQAETKREILRETLQRTGRVEWPGDIAIHAADPWQYRNHTRLQLGRDAGGKTLLGFFEADSHRVTPIDACLICSPRLNQIISELLRPEWRERLKSSRELELLADDQDRDVFLTLRGSAWENAETLARDFMATLPGVVGVRIERVPEQERAHLPHRPARSDRPAPGAAVLSFGHPWLLYRVGNFEYRVSAGSFFQSSRFLLPDFVNCATHTEGLRQRSAFDLYAGVGLFTLPLASQFERVVAVEAHAGAAADLARNVRGLANSGVRTVAATAAEFLRRNAQGSPELVIVDPPRAGLEPKTLRLIVELRPQQINYATCHPPTLARDLAGLLGHGYRLESIDMFDLFPQTFHIEAVAKLCHE